MDLGSGLGLYDCENRNFVACSKESGLNVYNSQDGLIHNSSEGASLLV